jgi:2,4'-dihydroxyacetophenone dioxygenase
MCANRGFLELHRLEPGVVMPVHRYPGEGHAFNLEGSRKHCTGEVIDAGQYVYEPAGNINPWIAVGDRPLVVFAVVMGEVEFLGENLGVQLCVNAVTQWKGYREHCASHGLMPQDLVE